MMAVPIGFMHHTDTHVTEIAVINETAHFFH